MDELDKKCKTCFYSNLDKGLIDGLTVTFTFDKKQLNH
jgi:hypothetical protein